MPNPTTNETGRTPSRRDEILAVAATVIAERGIKQATVRDIGEAAGILSGSLYHHFSSKDQIVLELLLPALEEAVSESTIACERHSGLEAVGALIRRSVSATARNPERSIIFRNEAQLFQEMPLLRPLAKMRLELIELWIGAIEQGIASGEIRSTIDPQVIARAMLDGTLGASRWFTRGRQADPEAIGDALIEFYLSGLRQHGTPPAR